MIDPGLQPERTLLAWRRTALALAGAAAVGVHLAVVRLSPAAMIMALLCLVLSLALVAESQLALGSHHEALARPRPAFRLLVTCASCIVALAATGLALALT